MEYITVVQWQINPDDWILFGAYKTPQAARTAINVWLMGDSRRSKYSVNDFLEETVELED